MEITISFLIGLVSGFVGSQWILLCVMLTPPAIAQEAEYNCPLVICEGSEVIETVGITTFGTMVNCHGEDALLLP